MHYSQEAMYYNALAIQWHASYKRLVEAREQRGTWESAWNHGSGFFPLDPQREMEQLSLAGIGIVLKEEPGYPALLKEIDYPPLALYYRGTLPPSSLSIAMVGTRKPTPEGEHCAEDMGADLARRGWVIVSGLAFGIDRASHMGALRERGVTVAVLAHGLHMIQPESHTSLGERILAEGGAIVSEYPIGMPALKNNFIARNRIISGLAKGVVIIEAPRKSGALKTAYFATEQNREVLVVPGPMRHPNFQGSHALIRKGASLVTSVDDIETDLGILGSTASSSRLSLESHDTNTQAILDTISSCATPITIDKISEVTNLNVQIVITIITVLTLKGIIQDTINGISLA